MLHPEKAWKKTFVLIFLALHDNSQFCHCNHYGTRVDHSNPCSDDHFHDGLRRLFYKHKLGLFCRSNSCEIAPYSKHRSLAYPFNCKFSTSFSFRGHAQWKPLPCLHLLWILLVDRIYTRQGIFTRVRW